MRLENMSEKDAVIGVPKPTANPTGSILQAASATSQLTSTLNGAAERLRDLVNQLAQHNDELGMPQRPQDSEVEAACPDRDGLQGSIDDLVRLISSAEYQVSRFS